MLTLMVKEKSISIISDLSSSETPKPAILADRIFMYSKNDINITAIITFQQETYTCTHQEDSEVFSFIQSRA
jgi:hypothetical protein